MNLAYVSRRSTPIYGRGIRRHYPGCSKDPVRMVVNNRQQLSTAISIFGGSPYKGIAREVYRKCEGTEYRQLKNAPPIPPQVGVALSRSNHESWTAGAVHPSRNQPENERLSSCGEQRAFGPQQADVY